MRIFGVFFLTESWLRIYFFLSAVFGIPICNAIWKEKNPTKTKQKNDKTFSRILCKKNGISNGAEVLEMGVVELLKQPVALDLHGWPACIISLFRA